MIRFLTQITVFFLLGTSVNAQQIRTVERDEIEVHLTGLEDFDTLTPSALPGNSYARRLAFPGLKIGSHFDGQTAFINRAPLKRWGASQGPARSPLKVPQKTMLSRLNVIADADESTFLASSIQLDLRSAHGLRQYIAPLAYPNLQRRIMVGYGPMAVSFKDTQFAFGFSLVLVKSLVPKQPKVKMEFYAKDGSTIGEPMLLETFGEYTFWETSFDRVVSGFSLENIGDVPVGIDDIVFETPLMLGRLVGPLHSYLK
ncbi:hypothetical protein [uncultured Pelagimonas sp.]|uniref:hypothetical protein n=1 Tax=uncultured Pelagimonas sp. TaxID=1618102 RepID=UPI00260C555D|nr:hypothetical protein [uncultured Pelagimonas sp.]